MSSSASTPRSAIPDQVRLPFSVAWEIVVQGIRIRLGRSMVTLLGVVFGVAFLMSILTAHFIREQVSGEIALRQAVVAMTGFLAAETGALEGRALAVFQTGAPDREEERFLEGLKRAGVTEFLSAEAVAGAAKGNVSALVVVGSSLPAEVWASVASHLRQNVVAFTRMPEASPEGATVVNLRRPPSPDDLDKQSAERSKGLVRTIWIISIATLVTMISISNALLMSVTERFREIGTMKCLGGLSSFIRRIFFIESALLGFVGSLLGAIFGLLFAILLYALTYGWALVLTSLPLGWLLGSFVVCLVGGVMAAIIAAIYPAGFASRMVPATALRTNI